MIHNIHNAIIVDYVFFFFSQATVSMDGAKLTTQFPNYHHLTEISGGKLVEVRFLMSGSSDIEHISNETEISLIFSCVSVFSVDFHSNHGLRPCCSEESQQEALIDVTVHC